MTQVTLFERCQLRIETDIDEAELERIIDEANLEVIQRYGPHADTGNPITVKLAGGAQTLDLARPLDEAEDFTITEFWRTSWGGSPQSRVLEASDFQVWFGGRTIERLYTGDSPAFRWSGIAPQEMGFGGSAGWVTVEYVPVNDGNQREEVVIKLVLLNIEYNGKIRTDIAGLREFEVVFQEERERLLRSLAPRKGMLIR